MDGKPDSHSPALSVKATESEPRLPRSRNIGNVLRPDQTAPTAFSLFTVSAADVVSTGTRE